MADIKTLTARCYCKAVHFTLDLPASELPLKAHMCHCSVCRYTHGTLCVMHAPLPKGVMPRFVAPSSLEGSLTVYQHAKSKCRRYFCSTCGCHIGDTGLDDPNWFISTSIYDDAGREDKFFEFRSHVFSKSARDGGMAQWVSRIAGQLLRDWNPDPAEDAEGARVVEQEPEPAGPDGEERLRAQCHCGGVSFTLPRPPPELAHHPKFKHFLSPIDKGKWMACTDMCDDCRIIVGAHVPVWTFVPRSLLLPQVPADLRLGTSKTYSSSEGTLRSFCGTCGASIFFSCNDRVSGDDMVLDISAGILRAPEGPLAENWLTWRAGRVGWLDSGLRYDEDFTKALAEGMGAWGREKYGEDLDFDIGSP